MASSSVSQDDVDNDFEKNSRRSRIRTARARQINPAGNMSSSAAAMSSCRAESSQQQASRLEDEGELYPEQPTNEFAADTSPKPVGRNSIKELSKRNLPNKLPAHHVNKGKQQRDRRKLREKRRSTGVVHLASTESTTGGSTTGDDGESSDALPAAKAPADPSANVAGSPGSSSSTAAADQTKRNTQLNEALSYNHHYHHPTLSASASASKTHHRSNSTSSTPAALYPASIMRSSAGMLRNRHKSHSDLEADDENDHDSLNQSDASSAFSSSNHLPGLTPSLQQAEDAAAKASNSCSTPVVRPATPTGDSYPEQIERVVEENKRLLSLMEEKDRKIHLLEYQIQQLMKDTSSKSEEQARLQRENSTLLRALANITAAKKES